MTAYMMSALVASVVMAMGAAVFYAGFRSGASVAVDRRITALLERALDPGDYIGRLPSEMDDETDCESTGRHALREDFVTDTFPAVGSNDLIADDDSIPGKRLRDFYRQQAQWPSDMELAERESIVEDSTFERTVDAANRGEQ